MSLCVNYLPEPDEGEDEEEETGILKMTEKEIPVHYDSNDDLINVVICGGEEGDEVEMYYLPSCYREESMHRFRRMIMKSAALMVQYAEEPGRKVAQLISDIGRNSDVKSSLT